MSKFQTLILLVSLLLAGCASTNLPPATSSEYTLLDDEKRVWHRSEEEQQRLYESEILFENDKLSAYLNALARKLLPPEAQGKIPVEVLVINNPYSNAFAYPNGKVYIHTGILARMDNEAQLATLLGHEMSHFTHRHQIRQWRSLRNKSAGLASFRATFGSVPIIGDLSSALGEIGTMAAVSGYSKGMESEADDLGLQLMIDAGYDPKEAPKLFEYLIAEAAEEDVEEPFFFGSHPKLQDRLENYRQSVAALGTEATGKVGQEVFEKKVALAIYETAFLDLKAGRFAKAEKGVNRYLRTYPKSSRAYFLLGEVYRQRNAEGDQDKAIKFLKKTVEMNPKNAESYRSLGIVYMKAKQKKKARKAFNNYLQCDPEAEDRGFIENYVQALR